MKIIEESFLPPDGFQTLHFRFQAKAIGFRRVSDRRLLTLDFGF